MNVWLSQSSIGKAWYTHILCQMVKQSMQIGMSKSWSSLLWCISRISNHIIVMVNGSRNPNKSTIIWKTLLALRVLHYLLLKNKIITVNGGCNFHTRHRWQPCVLRYLCGEIIVFTRGTHSGSNLCFSDEPHCKIHPHIFEVKLLYAGLVVSEMET